MADLKTVLISYMRGKSELDDVSSALTELMQVAPEKAPLVQNLFARAHEKGLPAHAFATLCEQLSREAGPGAPEEQESQATVVSDRPPISQATVKRDPAPPAVDDDTAPVVRHDPAAGLDSPAHDDLTQLDAAEAESTLVPAQAMAGRTDARLGPQGHDAPTLVATRTTAPDDATQVNTASPGAGLSIDDSPGHEDATEVALDGEATKEVDTDFDVLSRTALNAPGGSQGKQMPGTGASWPTGVEAPGSGAGISREFREGDLLRGRFQLISKLGEGGMGAVWKGLDRLKEEARDRNPFVAIKLLQGDFKEHPEAFIALQRETSKQQRLAHPNIATVYDFDRDDVTNTVFMTMEVLEGQPLDAFVRKLPADGLAEKEAMPLIEQLCNGLSYAHSHGLVHSDLKPGNCFLTKEGNIKLLDFGIARASKTKSDAEGDTTLFDPGQLGALTPTYATIEMFEGEDPDPRDDIYALGIMSYQLLTGKHPYDRKSAPNAKEMGLRPEPVEKLSKSQNRGLQRSVAFARDDRVDTVEAFLTNIQRKKSRAPLYATMATVLGLIVAGALYPTIADWMEHKKRDEIIAEMSRPGIQNIRAGLARAKDAGDKQMELILEEPAAVGAVAHHMTQSTDEAQRAKNIEEGLRAIAPYENSFQNAVLRDDGVRKAIFDLFESRIVRAFSPEDKRYDYVTATEQVDRLDTLYPDSAEAMRLRDSLETEKKSTLSALAEKYKRFLDEGFLIPSPNEENIGDVLNVVREIDPKNRLLTDKRLTFAFTKQAERAIAASNYSLANDYLQASAAFIDNDKLLNDLRYQVATELQRINNAKRITKIDRQLAGRVPSLKSLKDFEAIRHDLAVLADLSPHNETLLQLRVKLEKIFTAALRDNILAERWNAAESLLFDFSRLLGMQYLRQQRTHLSTAEAKAGFELAQGEKRQAVIQAKRKDIRALLAEPAFNTGWEIKLKGPFKELTALLPPGAPALTELRDAVASLYLEQARKAREAGSFSEALAFVHKGRRFHPDSGAFDEEITQIEAAKKRERLARLEEERLARIANLKEEFMEKAANDEVSEAKTVMEQLAGEKLAAGDDFLTAKAPALLSSAYTRRAAALADSGEYRSALMLAKAAMNLTPTKANLAALVANYQVEADGRKTKDDLEALFDSQKPLDVARVKENLLELEQKFPNEYTKWRKSMGANRSQEIVSLAADPKGDLATVGLLLDQLKAVIPEAASAAREKVEKAVEHRLTRASHDNPGEIAALQTPLAQYARISAARHEALSQRIGDDIATRVKTLRPTEPAAAFAMWDAARTAVPASARIASMKMVRPAPPGLALAREAIRQGELTSALQLLLAAEKKDPNHTQVAEVKELLTAATQSAEKAYAQYKREADDSIRRSDQNRFDKRLEGIRRKWSDRKPAFKRIKIAGIPAWQCHRTLAGHGKKRTCYDHVAGRKGPLLIVVPEGGSIDKAFAISKYEITVNDFNHYCRKTKRCKAVRRNTGIPKTNLSLADAEAYAAWLSREASKKGHKVIYRLPTDAEWEHAASALGQQPPKHYNCTVMNTSGNKIAGHALLDARTGASNSWGLTNYVGNAQEWVRAGGTLRARGGNFEDPLDKCDMSINRQHSGRADPITGFRLVRELD